MRTLVSLTVLAVVALAAAAPADAHRRTHGVPPAIDVHAVDPHARLILRARVIAGAQIYRCAAAPDGSYAWTLVGPQAVLAGHRRALIYHSFGPRWELLSDGSAITGTILASAPSETPGAIAQLLLKATPDPSAPRGRLTRVAYVQRLKTTGGQPQATCTTDTAGTVTEARYTAEYRFWVS